MQKEHELISSEIWDLEAKSVLLGIFGDKISRGNPSIFRKTQHSFSKLILFWEQFLYAALQGCIC